MSIGQSQEGRDGAEVRIPPPLFYLVAVVLGVVLHRTCELEFAPGSSLRIVLGVAVLCGGIAILGSSFSVFRRIGQHPDPRKPTPVVARDGPYRFTRNPMYFGGILGAIGIGLVFRSIIVTIFATVLQIVIYRSRILVEEQLLLKAFGEEYTKYKKRTKRLIPFIY